MGWVWIGFSGWFHKNNSPSALHLHPKTSLFPGFFVLYSKLILKSNKLYLYPKISHLLLTRTLTVPVGLRTVTVRQTTSRDLIMVRELKMPRGSKTRMPRESRGKSCGMFRGAFRCGHSGVGIFVWGFRIPVWSVGGVL
jgi:hypothetical protein